MRFVDYQVRGPFGSWWHEHLFAAAPGGSTWMRDHVEFRSPFGPIGAIVDAGILGRYMRRLLEQRNVWLKATLEAPTEGR